MEVINQRDGLVVSQLCSSGGMMAFLVWSLLALVASVRAQDDKADILESNFEEYNPETKKYEYSFETSNGISRHETGVVLSDDEQDGDLEVEGSYSFEGTDGVLYTVTYTAGKNGYRPVTHKAGESGIDTRVGGSPAISSAAPVNNRIAGTVLESLAGG